MNRFLLALLVVASVYGAYDYGRSQGSMKITFRAPCYPGVIPLLDMNKTTVAYDGYGRVTTPKHSKHCKEWVTNYNWNGFPEDMVCMDDLSVAERTSYDCNSTVTKSGSIKFPEGKTYTYSY